MANRKLIAEVRALRDWHDELETPVARRPAGRAIGRINAAGATHRAPGHLGRTSSPWLVSNEAGGAAYPLTAEQALAQYASTGCLYGTYYTTAREHLQTVLELAAACTPTFLAQTALFARERGAMKTMPAMLCAVLAARDGALLERIFARVVDSSTMLRSFVQILRSGAVGRRSLGSLPRRLVRQWLATRSDRQLFHASIGTSPSLADIVRMVHPKPATPARDNLHRYLLGKPFSLDLLPPEVAQLELCKLGQAAPPDVNFQFLTNLPLTTAHWQTIARQASWTTTRMNLNTFLRHGVFADTATTEAVAAKLRDEVAIRRAKAFPYQILAARLNASDDLPASVRAALEEALEVATTNVPTMPGKVVLAVDVSGSMHSPVTGHRGSASTKVRCIDVAALFAAAILRQNPTAMVIPFHETICKVTVDPKARVLETAQILINHPGGGTDCSAVLRHLNQHHLAADVVVYLSDNQSWVDHTLAPTTATSAEWRQFRRANPKARLVCIDLQPHRTVQACAALDVVHVGGFSDQVFDVLHAVANGDHAPDLLLERIRAITF